MRPTTSFLEALRKAPPEVRRWTGFDDTEECRRYTTRFQGDLGAEQFRGVDFSTLLAAE